MSKDIKRPEALRIKNKALAKQAEQKSRLHKEKEGNKNV